MGVELKDLLRQQLRANGGVLPPMPDGPMLERFNALELAQGLESEINRAGEKGFKNVRLDMSLEDSQALASFLRRAVLMGV